MMRRRKKPDPNAPPPPPRDNGLPPRPPELNAAATKLAEQLKCNVAAGFGFASSSDGGVVAFRERKGTVGEWRLYVFTNDAAAVLPSTFEGFPVERRAVPVPFQAPRKWP